MCLKLLLYKKAEKERLRRSKTIWRHFWAGLVSGLDLSWGRLCLRAGLVQKLQGRKCLAARSVQKCRAGSVSQADLIYGRKCLGARTRQIEFSEDGQYHQLTLLVLKVPNLTFCPEKQHSTRPASAIRVAGSVWPTLSLATYKLRWTTI